MKATQKDFASIAPRAAKEARVFFLCGQDDASVQDAAHRIAGLLADPGERVEIAGAELKRDPVKLSDEARSTSLFGDSRHIWVRCSGDEAHDAVANLVEGDVTGWPVIIQATNASDKSRTFKLLEKRADALAAMFYPPDLGSVTQTVRHMAGAAGVTIDNALAQRIASAVGLDTRMAASEVAKLALYLNAVPESPKNARPEDFDAVGAFTLEDGFTSLVNVVLGGDVAKVPAELRRVVELGLNPVGLLLVFERRVAQLAQMAGRMGPGGDVNGFIEQERQARRVFWKDAADLTRQLRIWRGKKLERLLSRIMAMHRALLTNSSSAELLLMQGLTEISHVAARRD